MLINNSASAFIKNPTGIFEIIDETCSLVSHAVNFSSSIHLGDTGSTDGSLILISLYAGIATSGSCMDTRTTFFVTGLYFSPLDSLTAKTKS